MADAWNAKLLDWGMEHDYFLAQFATSLISKHGADIQDWHAAAVQTEVLLRLGGGYEQIEALVRQLAGLPEESPPE